jgi:glycosyltransferase involved in cell wall biosynthesis
MRDVSSPTVSVILPVYNGGGSLLTALESVLAQSFTDWELICVDDGSTDGTAEVLAAFAARDSRVVVLTNQPNQGLQYSLNRALAKAKGRYIARLDADDTWCDPEKLQVQVDFMETHPDHVAVGAGSVVVNGARAEQYRYLQPLADAQIRGLLLGKNCFIHGTMLLRRAALDEVGGYDSGPATKHVEDYDLWLKLGRVGKLANLPRYSLRYTVSAGQISTQNRRLQLQKNIYLMNRYRADYPGYLRAWAWNYARLLVYGVLRLDGLVRISAAMSQRLFRGNAAPASTGQLPERKRLTVLTASTAAGGGAEVVMSRLANYFADSDGYQTELVAVLPPPAASVQFSDKLSVRHLGRPSPERSLGAVIRYLRRENPDVVIAGAMSMDVIVCMAKWLSGWHGQLILTMHSTYRGMMTGYSTWATFKFRVLYWLGRLLFPRFAEKVVFVSKRSMAEESPLLGLRSGQAVWVPNPAVPEGPLPERAAVAGRPFTVVSLSRLSPERGIRFLITGFAEFAAEHPDSRLLIYGAGPEQAALESLAAASGAGSRIEFMGRTDEPLTALAAADCLVSPALVEGFGLTLVEAMAVRCPVIAADAPYGPGEIIEDGVSGLLVPVGDARAIAVALGRLAEGADLATRLAQGGHARAQDFRLHSIGIRYRSLIDGNPPIC